MPAASPGLEPRTPSFGFAAAPSPVLGLPADTTSSRAVQHHFVSVNFGLFRPLTLPLSCPSASGSRVWDADPEAIQTASDLYYGDALRTIVLGDGFTAHLMEHETYAELLAKPPEYRVYAEALIELHRLIDEIRFECALAVLILVDYRVKRDRGDAPRSEESSVPPIPLEALALIMRYIREPPSPGQLFFEPHTEMAGSRILSRWLAAQLLDSALYRAVAASDRLTVLLQARAGRPFTVTKAGGLRYPTFTPSDLRKLNEHYEGRAEWRELREVATNPLFVFVREARHEFTHGLRLPFELHGEKVRASVADPLDVAGIDVDDHVALVLALYDGVLRPAVELTEQLLEPTPEQARE